MSRFPSLRVCGKYANRARLYKKKYTNHVIAAGIGVGVACAGAVNYLTALAVAISAVRLAQGALHVASHVLNRLRALRVLLKSTKVKVYA